MPTPGRRNLETLLTRRNLETLLTQLQKGQVESWPGHLQSAFEIVAKRKSVEETIRHL
jgi:hypothetical protein